MWTLSRTGINGDPIVAEVVVRVKYFYVVTLALNVICAGAWKSVHIIVVTSCAIRTALISWRIWRVESESRALAKANTDGPDLQINDGIPVGRVINVIVESGEIYMIIDSPFYR